MRNRPSLAVWAVVLTLIVAAFLTGGLIIRRSVRASFDSTERIRMTRMYLFGALKGQLDEETGVRGYAATHDAVFLEPYFSARKSLPKTFQDLRTSVHALKSPSVERAVDAAQQTNNIWLTQVASPILSRHVKDPMALETRGKILVDGFRVDIAQIDRALAQRNRDISADVATSLTFIDVLVAATAFLFVVAGAVFSTVLARTWDRLEVERRQTVEEHARADALRVAYEAEKRITNTLQDAVLPPEMPTTTSMTFSAIYVPAAEKAKVGGDWYEAVELRKDRVLFTIGDVAGHGIEAAVTMSHIRTAVLSAALLGDDPALILSRVNRRILTRSSTMVTAIVGVADSRRYEFLYSTAGHPPPVLLEPKRPPRLLEYGGLPLGITEAVAYRTFRVQSVPGSVLILYTDGVIEHSRNLLEGQRLLLEAVSALHSEDDGDIATAIFKSIFIDKSVGDDVAILALGFARAEESDSVGDSDGRKAS
jgi:phosphoserine phosphatase RsbU/P